MYVFAVPILGILVGFVEVSISLIFMHVQGNVSQKSIKISKTNQNKGGALAPTASPWPQAPTAPGLARPLPGPALALELREIIGF